MPTNTYTAIASVTLSATASEVVFSALPQTFRDLIVVSAIRTLATNTNGIGLNLHLNGDLTAGNYSYVSIEAGSNGIRSLSGADPYIARINSSQSSNTDLTTVTIQVMDYSQTNKHKTSISRSSGKDGVSDFALTAHASRWANTSAVTSLRLTSSNNDFPSGCTFNLFGVIA
jgi:hypothetical protein